VEAVEWTTWRTRCRSPTRRVRVFAEVAHNMKTIETVGWLLILDRSLLMVRSFGTDAFYVPGGKLEEGESPSEALCREVQEELSVSLAPDSIEPAFKVHANAHGRPNTLVTIECFFGDYSGELQPTSEIAEMQWQSAVELAHGLAPAAILLGEELQRRDLIN
jgi:8-oxo-dGTP diphosphatase